MNESVADFKEYLAGIQNDVKIAIDDLFTAIENIGVDLEHIKIKTSKPDKHAAALLLDYLSWEDGQSKQNLENLCGKEIKEYMKWLEYYCKREGTTREQALKAVIDGEI